MKLITVPAKFTRTYMVDEPIEIVLPERLSDGTDAALKLWVPLSMQEANDTFPLTIKLAFKVSCELACSVIAAIVVFEFKIGLFAVLGITIE